MTTFPTEWPPYTAHICHNISRIYIYSMSEQNSGTIYKYTCKNSLNASCVNEKNECSIAHKGYRDIEYRVMLKHNS